MAWFLKRALPAPAAPITPSSLLAAIGDPALAERIVVRASPKARRVSLRVNVTDGVIELVHPRRMSAKAVLAFAASRQDWIAKHLRALPPRVAFEDGARLPLRGKDHILRLAPDSRGGVWKDGDTIVIAGRAEHARRRLIDWLKAEAKLAIGPLARALAEQLDRTVANVTVRDTTSRWGSCTRSGRLSFSWRLILAPDHVLRYVTAHEVAHLKHMNHGPAFWRTVDQLMNNEGEAAELARDWLRRNGAVLHRYG